MDTILKRYEYVELSGDEKGSVNGNLKSLRQRRALSLTDLALISKIGRVTINRIENGKQRPRPRTIRALAEALQVDVEYLTSEQSRFI